MQPRTITEKIIAVHGLEGLVGPGQIATVSPDVLLLNEVSGPLTFDQFAALERKSAERAASIGLPVGERQHDRTQETDASR